MDRHPTVAVAGPLLRDSDGNVQSSRRRFPTLVTAFFESTWLETWAPRSVLARYYAADLPDDVPVEVDWVVGAALMVRTAVAKTVGPMDEAYFMYSEELDWCRRIKDAGWRVLQVPAAEIVHHEGKSSEQAVTDRHINFQRAKLRYFYKYHGRFAALLLRIYLLANYAIQLAIEATKGLLGHRRDLRRQRISAYMRVLASGLRIAGEG
jgi:GT2 family glycosyltransferase